MTGLEDAAREAIRLHMPEKSRGDKIAALKHIRAKCWCDLRSAMLALDRALASDRGTYPSNTA